MSLKEISDAFVIGPVKDKEINLIKQSFLKSNRNKGINFYANNEDYYKQYSILIDLITGNSHFKVETLKLKSMPDLVIGYIIYSGVGSKDINVHFLFIKFSYRNEKLGSLLLQSVVGDREFFYTENLPFKASDKKHKLDFLGKKFKYRPFILRSFV